MAADLTQSWLGKHFEKLILAGAAALLAASIALFVVLREGRGGSVMELRGLIGNIRAKIDETQKTEDDAAVLKQALNPAEYEALNLGEEPLTAEAFFDMMDRPAAEMPPGIHIAGVKYVEPEEGPDEDQPVPALPARILAVQDVETVVGRGVTDEQVPRAAARLEERGLADVLWASSIGRFDVTEQFRLNQAGHTNQNKILITRVDLQRRERKPDGAWAEWADVPSVVPESFEGKLPRQPENAGDKRAVYQWYLALEKQQTLVRRMPFVNLAAADGQVAWAAVAEDVLMREAQPGLRVAKAPTADEASPAMAAAPAATAGIGGWRPEGLEDVAEPGTGAEADVPFGPPEEEPDHVFATVWAHDLTAVPGRTYQYRMRVAIFNPVYSLRTKSPDNRWVPSLEGRWSEPGPAVTVPPLVEYFFVGTFGDRANLELHRWIHGQWVVVPSAPVDIGRRVVYRKARHALRVPGSQDEIQVDVDLTPEALLVDLIRDLPYSPGGRNRTIPTNVLVVAGDRNQLAKRIEWDDKKAALEVRAERQNDVPEAPPPPPWAGSRGR